MNIPISEKHGINPALDLCFFCHKPKGVVLFGKLNERKMTEMFGPEFTEYHLKHADDADTEAPRSVVTDTVPCDGCEVWTKYAGECVFFIEAGGEDGNPKPTGDFVAVREQAVREIINDEKLLNHVLKVRAAYIDPELWLLIGLDKAEDAPQDTPETTKG